MTDNLWDVAERAAGWLDDANGADNGEITLRILKLSEETGEVAAAWIGAQGGNPRKGFTHTRDEVAAELGDVAMSALVAIASIGKDPRAVMAEVATKIDDRLGEVNSTAAGGAVSPACQDRSP